MTKEAKQTAAGFISFILFISIILLLTNIGEPTMEQTQTQVQEYTAEKSQHEVCFFHDFKREQIAEGVFITGRLPVDVYFDVRGNEILINEIILNRADGVKIEGTMASYVIDLGVMHSEGNVYRDAKNYIEENILKHLIN